MTTYYVDPENGNDANDGLSWGTAYKTLLNGATAARLGTTDADEIRIAKSPDPVSIGNVTWTQASNTLTTNCSNVVISQCDSGWTAGLVTPTYTTSYYRQGTASVQNVLASTNGKVSYVTFASLDLSAYARITFWINFGTAVNYSASNPIEIHLCSDTAGNTTALKFTLPRYYYPANHWVPITLEPDAGYSFASTGSNIQSLALKTVSAVTNTIRLDNITVAKAAADSTSLVLTDVVAKNETVPFWFQINNIDGASVDIRGSAGDQAAASAANQTAYVSRGGTATVDTIKRWGFNTATDVVLTTNTAAGPGALVYTNIIYWPATKTYIGGVNTSSDVVDGETWFDGSTCYGFGVTQTNSQTGSYSISNVSAMRYYDNFTLQQSSKSTVAGCNSVAAGRNGVAVYYINADNAYHMQSTWTFGCVATGSSGYNRQLFSAGGGTSGSANASVISLTPLVLNVSHCRAPNSGAVIDMAANNNGVIFTSTGTIIAGNASYVISNSSSSVGISSTIKLDLNDVYWSNGAGTLYGLSSFSSTAPNLTGAVSPLKVIIRGEFGARSTADVFVATVGPGSGAIIIDLVDTGTWLAASTASEIASTNFSGANIVIRNFRSNRPSSVRVSPAPGTLVSMENAFDGTNYRIYRPFTTTTPFTATTDFWELQSAVSYAGGTAWKGILNGPHRLPLGAVVLKGGSAATITVRVNRSSTFNRTRFVAFKDMDNTLVATATSTDTWQLLTITHTPTENCVVYPWIIVDNVSAQSTIYVDDLQVTQA